MTFSPNLRLVIQSLLALAHLLPLAYLLFRRLRGKRLNYASLIVYCALSVLWGVGVALGIWGTGRTDVSVLRVVGYGAAGVSVLMVALLVSITRQNFDRPGHWAWGAVGAAWTLVILGLLFFPGVGVAVGSVAVLARVGWLLFSAVLVFLSAWWTLKAALGFYRNRGIYWLGLLILLLAGQGLVWLRFQWAEISLMLHLLGTVGIIVCITTHHLPNVKAALRTATGYIVLTVTTALLLLAGLLAGQFLFRIWSNLYSILIGSAVLAIVLALVYQPFHRLITWLVNRLVWRNEYDLDQIVREYGRTIGNLLTLEQLATVVIGTVNEVLGVQRGVLVVVSKAEYQIALRAIGGMGQIENRETALALNSPILLHLMVRREPFSPYDLEHRPDLQGAPEAEKAWLRALGVEIFIPILARDRLLGLLALGPQRRGEPYGLRDVAFLITLCEQTSVALQNAYLFDEVRGLYTRISRLNEDLRQAYARLKKLDQAKTDFLSISSHELRTPLTVIQGYVGIMEELASNRSLTPTQMLEIIQNFKAAIERLAAVVTAMLDASQIEVEALDLHFASTTLNAVMTMALGQWREASEERHQQLTVEGIETIPPIEADVQRLCQAFGNMISNAVKYTPDGGKISVRASLAEDGEHFEVAVADTGVGINREDQLLIFEPFYRVGSLLRHSTGDAKFQGAGPGLGLRIARGVIEAHGGRIWVESEGRDEEHCPGSVFHMWLPLHPTPAEAV
jgi:signal transduction histidine kinase